MNGCFWKQTFAFNSPQTPLNLILLTILVTLQLSDYFKLKIEQLSSKKLLKFDLNGKCFSDVFTES